MLPNLFSFPNNSENKNKNTTSGIDFENQCRNEVYTLDKNHSKQLSLLSKSYILLREQAVKSCELDTKICGRRPHSEWLSCLPGLAGRKAAEVWLVNFSRRCCHHRGRGTSDGEDEQLKTIYLVGFAEEGVTRIKCAIILLSFLISSFSFFPP